MNWFTSLSLQKRIGFLVLSGLAIGLGLFSWLGLGALNESSERILEERLTVARIMANQLDETLRHILWHLQEAANLNIDLFSPGELSLVADSLERIFTESGISLRNILLADTNGKVLQVEPSNPSIIGVDLSQYVELDQVLLTRAPLVSNVIANPALEAHVILAAAPVFNENGVLVALLVSLLDIQTSDVQILKQTIQIGNTGYIEIVDGNGVVLARTEPGLPPLVDEKSDHPGRFAELIRKGETTVGTCHRCHETPAQLERRRDILAFAPLSTASWGVAIRQSEEEALAATQQLQRRLILLGITVLAVTLFLLYLMMQGFVRPVKILTGAVKRVASGDLKSIVPVKRADEIGQLSIAFNAMTQDLAKSKDELVSRNKELSILNSVVVTVSQSLDLNEILENALHNVLEVTNTTTGSVFLQSSDKEGKLELMSCRGPSDIFRCLNYRSAAVRCACHEVLSSGQTRMVKDISQCPRLDEISPEKDNIGYFVVVPLKSKSKTLGVLNIACPGERSFTENDLKLLDSVGYHVGLAIENSFLYKETKDNEILRGQLLSSIIGAQEEERKRIARELHDEYGQALAGLIMRLEILDKKASSAQPDLQEGLKDAKAVVVRALEDVRRLTLNLRPSALDYLGLVDTIRLYARTHLETSGIHVNFKSGGSIKRLLPAIEVATFRIVQEAIHNITKHAGAKNVNLSLELKDDKITVTVEDDGKGFDIESVIKKRIEGQSLGLLGMEERAKLLGGKLTVRSHAGQGTCLKVEIPLTI